GSAVGGRGGNEGGSVWRLSGPGPRAAWDGCSFALGSTRAEKRGSKRPSPSIVRRSRYRPASAFRSPGPTPRTVWALHLCAWGEGGRGTAKLQEAGVGGREALKERTRERVPLEWAVTQVSLGIALSALGGRESGTAKLEEAVVAYREALKENTRERVPLDWAMTFGNEGFALMRLAERTGDAAMAETALSQINTAFETMRDGGHAADAAYYERQLPRARALVARLGGRSGALP